MDKSTTSQDSKCPFCSASLRQAFLYVRGLGSSLHQSAQSDVGLLSRKGLELIDLSDLSITDTGSQAVVHALACDDCGSLSFKTSP